MAAVGYKIVRRAVRVVMEGTLELEVAADGIW